jgi:hypothetical protein
MKAKRAVFAILAAFLVLSANLASGAVDVSEIDRIRSKGVLDSEDLQIIDDFVAEAVRDLVETVDFTAISKVRAVILSRTNSSKDSAEAQYAEQFFESAYRYISEAFEEASEIASEERRFKTILNLLILVDGLEDLRLADLAVAWLNDENKAIHYWVVHSVTNPVIAKQLNFTEMDDLKLALSIIRELKKLVNDAGPETLAMMAEFAAGVDIPQGEELLLQIADMRIGQYTNWAVEDELLDGTILKLLDSKIPASETSNPAVARRFGQLYSCVIQRYVKGRDFLSVADKHQLASVMVEIEILCISKRLRMAQSVIKTAVEQDDYITLLQEHSRLLGDETRAGKLPSSMNFDYGSKPDGDKRIAPLALPEPPMTEASEEEPVSE